MKLKSKLTKAEEELIGILLVVSMFVVLAIAYFIIA